MFQKFTTQFTLTLLILITVIFLSAIPGQADTNINETNRWAWSDNAGWWDFYSTGTVEVDGNELRGYATSSIGAMALNCNSTPSGDVCSTSNFRVTNPGATGGLSGCAWNDTIGWISFWCGDQDCDGSGIEDDDSICTSSNYRVNIVGGGEFIGYAWNDIEGWISFNCSKNSTCADVDYKLQTSWTANRIEAYLTSSIIDTGAEKGVTLKSIIWQGTLPANTDVDFQIAVSNSDSGPWNFTGPGDSSDNWYGAACGSSPVGGSSQPTAGDDVPICIDKRITKNNRYIRYKVRLQTDQAQDKTPVVENIILNWSE